MPRLIEGEAGAPIELGELIEALERGGFDPEDEDSLASFAPHLRRLAANRRFLGDLMIEELKRSCAGQLEANHYGAQVILLHGASRKFLLRANFWPSAADSAVVSSGEQAFFYGVPHDHNFSFMTIGYVGPGYWSDYYEYDYGEVVGLPGEPVNLKFIEKARLEEGKVMLYRAHKDVHLQLPADAMSVSLNILETSHATTFRDQYRFDLDNRRIEGIMTRTSLEPMLALAAHFGGDEGLDLLVNFARSHPSDRIRWCALRARAAASPSLDERIAVYEEGARTDSLLVSAMAKREAAKIEQGRAWIDGAPLRAAQQSAA